jgi:hypothetical protein
MSNQFNIGQIVKGIRAGEFVILGFREIGGETYAQLKEHNNGKLGRGEIALPLGSIKAA